MLIDAIDRIVNKTSRERRAAVFVVHGKIKTIGLRSRDYEDTTRLGQSRLLGVYTETCPINYIEDDLVWAQENMVR